jgi:hypothetical protein
MLHGVTPISLSEAGLTSLDFFLRRAVTRFAETNLVLLDGGGLLEFGTEFDSDEFRCVVQRNSSWRGRDRDAALALLPQMMKSAGCKSAA